MPLLVDAVDAVTSGSAVAAKAEAERMGMKPDAPAAWWDEPWCGEAEQVQAMRVASDEELGSDAC